MSLLDQMPLVAAAFALPQYVPQIVRLVRSRDTKGLSWLWAALTCVNNTAWLLYFVTSGYLLAPVTSGIAACASGAVAALLAAFGRLTRRAASVVAAWALVLVLAWLLAGGGGMGTALVVGATAQTVPSVVAAYRAPDPPGIALATWLLVLGELVCWEIFGVFSRDPRLIALGVIGGTASIPVVARVAWSGRARGRRRAGSRRRPVTT